MACLRIGCISLGLGVLLRGSRLLWFLKVSVLILGIDLLDLVNRVLFAFRSLNLNLLVGVVVHRERASLGVIRLDDIAISLMCHVLIRELRPRLALELSLKLVRDQTLQLYRCFVLQARQLLDVGRRLF